MPHTYDNLSVQEYDGDTHDKPTKDYLDTELAKLQALWDAQDYARKRAREYPTIADQFDMIYHDQVNSTTTFKDAIKAVKDKYAKG
jgi:predicted lipoprotein